MLSKKAIGRTYSPVLSSISAVEITIEPTQDTTVDVAGTLAHELLHAAGIRGHRRDFGKAGQQLGMVGKPRYMGFGSGLPPWALDIVADLGEYPEGRLIHPPKEQKQGTRMLKIECHVCGMIWRASRSAIEGKAIACPDSACSASLEVSAGEGEDPE